MIFLKAKIKNKIIVQKVIKKNNATKSKRHGFADTKKGVHGTKSHPSKYKKISRSSDDLEYVTFTHHEEVEIDNEKINTIELTSNIDPQKRGKEKSRVVPIVYKGKRSTLGKERTDLSLTNHYQKIVDDLFEKGERRPAPKKSK